MSNLARLREIYDRNKDQLLEDFFTFLRFESISSEPEFKGQVIDCAEWVKSYLQDMGMAVEVWETSGHPTIFAQNLDAGSEQPTVLIYNHYDVQPVDPLELWESAPFEPTVRDGEIYARGAQDNKGQCFYVLAAIKSLLERDGKLPVNLKLIIEGEEEVGSPGLSAILKERSSELQADYLFIVDVGFHDPEAPAVTLGIRGIATMSVELSESSTDLHSGSHGGMAYNPNHALVELLAKLRDAKGRVTVPGFYDDVVEITPEEKSKINFDFDEERYQYLFGTKPTGGETKYSALESAWVRPTLEINGVAGGYAGEGFKTVIPAKAIAKISCRLVPKQEPRKVLELVANFLKENTPPGVSIKIDLGAGLGEAVRTSPDSRAIKATAQAYEAVLEKPCHFIMEGGSIPIVVELAEASNSEVVLMGYGFPGDQIHAPNEHFGIDRIENGMLTIAQTLDFLAS